MGLMVLTAMSLPNFVSAGVDVDAAVNYLRTKDNSAWKTMALVATGESGLTGDHLKNINSENAIDYCAPILAITALGEDPRTYPNQDYVAKLKTYYNNNQMGDATLLNDDIWSILALASIYQADSTEAVAAKKFLLDNQNDDGGWGYSISEGSDTSDTNDTAAAIIALVEAGVSVVESSIVDALAYLQSTQNNDGGFPYDPNSLWGTDSDSGSDAWVIWALNKVGQDPASWTKGENSPITHLQSLQDAGDGGFWWIAGESEYNNKAMTPYAVIALAGKSFPVKPTKLSVSDTTLNYSESITITVEYFDGQSWLALAGATVNGADQSYLTNSSGQVVTVLPSGSYNLFSKKDGFVFSNEIEVEILAPVSTGGGGFISPTSCASVEYDEWQNACVNGWQYRNVLSLTPANCALTTEQESKRKRICVEDQEEKSNAPEEEEIKKEIEEEKVLGVKIENPDTSQPVENIIDADMIYFSKVELIVADVGAKRDLVKEKEGVNKYTKPLIKDLEELSGEHINAVTNFVVYGTKNTQNLGAGERAGVLNSYKSSFNKLPSTQAEWEDVIKIGSKILPDEINLQAEDKAKIEFKKVYERDVDMDNSSDKTAVEMIAYGLRPEKRNLDSERVGIRAFIEVYNYLPTVAMDWDIIRAIAYSGVKKTEI